MDDQILTTFSFMPQWLQSALVLSALLGIFLGLVAKPFALRHAGPVEQWPGWLRAVFAVLDVLAANSATVWRLAQLGRTQRALTEASSRVVVMSTPDPLNVPWAESAPPPPPPLPPKDGAS